MAYYLRVNREIKQKGLTYNKVSKQKKSLNLAFNLSMSYVPNWQIVHDVDSRDGRAWPGPVVIEGLDGLPSALGEYN